MYKMFSLGRNGFVLARGAVTSTYFDTSIHLSDDDIDQDIPLNDTVNSVPVTVQCENLTLDEEESLLVYQYYLFYFLNQTKQINRIVSQPLYNMGINL
jgi:hypothetical protein